MQATEKHIEYRVASTDIPCFALLIVKLKLGVRQRPSGSCNEAFTISAGSLSKTVSVAIGVDASAEINEEPIVGVSNITNGRIVGGSATGTIEYRLNGTPVFTSTYAGSPVFYIDTAFKNGAISLASFTLTQ